MTREKIFNKHFDLSHSILYNEYPEEYTKTIGVPGKFTEKVNRRVHLKNGTCGEMDSADIANPDGKILLKKAAVCLEHQSKVVEDAKLNIIGYYDIQLVTDENLPTLLVIASHLDPKKSKNKLIHTPSDTIELYFLDLSEKNICQRLNKLKEKINNNEKISIEDALNLGVILLYAPRQHAYEITETVVNLYLKIVPAIDLKMENCLYSVITILIDAYIDDEKTYRRLINMIENNTSPEVEPLYETKKALLKSLKWKEEDLTAANKTIAEKDKSIAEKDKNLAEKDKSIAEANATIDELKREIQILKTQNAK